jgi:hypothetical protein
MALSTDGVTTTTTLKAIMWECMFTTSQLSITHRNNNKMSTKKRGKGKSDANIKASAGPSSVTSIASTLSAFKLSLAKSLQDALTTMAGLSEDQFNKIWENACNALRN